MVLPANNKQVGDLGHADDHNSIVNEINAVIAASANYLPISSSANYLFAGTASVTYLRISASSNFVPLNINTVTSTSAIYRLQLSDAGKLLEMNNSASNIILIPLNTSVAFPIGTKIDILQVGTGPTTASIDTGVTLNSDTNKRTINAQWAAASLVKRDTDTWVLIGAIKA